MCMDVIHNDVYMDVLMCIDVFICMYNECMGTRVRIVVTFVCIAGALSGIPLPTLNEERSKWCYSNYSNRASVREKQMVLF